MTRLKALELFGFKSFADRTRFEFPEGVTVVVGPNGSGKSNVVDAIKWVLGEQSVRSLRGKEMADVIFAGSVSRRPLNSAEVSLIFDNSAGLLPVEAAEVQIMRRVQRSGESEYLVNGESSRLRDIRELLSGTGAATEAYSVIEQGRVDALLVASGRERRAVFEEAAGITRFRSRRAEALRRLERAEQNRQRLADITGEVASRLETVKHQAARARRWRQMTDRLREFRIVAAMQDLAAADAAVSEVDTLLATIRSESGAVDARVTSTASDVAALETSAADLLPGISAARAAYATDTQRAAATEATLSLQRTLRAEVEKELTRTTAALSTARAADRTAAAAAAEAEENSARLAAQLDAISGRLQACTVAAQGTHHEATDHRERLAAATHLLDERRQEMVRSEADAARAEERAAEARQAADAAREAVAAAHGLQARCAEAIAAWQGNMAAVQATLDDAARDVAAADEAQRAANGSLAAARAEVSTWNAKLEACRERHAILQEIVARQEGLSDASRRLLACDDARVPGLAGALADLLVASIEWAPVVDLALGALGQSLVVDSLDATVHWHADWAAGGAGTAVLAAGGRISFVAIDGLRATVPFEPGPHPGLVGRLDTLVLADCPEAAAGRSADLTRMLLERLLGRVWIVDRIEHALPLLPAAPAGTLFMTRAGHTLTADGVFEVGAATAAAGLVARRSELRAVEQRRDEILRTVEDAAQRLAALEVEADRRHDAVRQAHLRRQQAAEAIASSRAELERVRRDERNAEAGIRVATAEQRTADQRAATAATALQAARAAVAAAAEALDSARGAARQAESAMNDLERSRGELVDEIHRLRVDEATCREKLSLGRDAVATLAATRLARGGDVAAAHAEVERAGRRLDAYELDLLAAGSLHAEAVAAQERSAACLADLEAEAEGIESGRRIAAAALEQLRVEAARLADAVHAHELEAGAARHRRARIVERIRDEYDIDIEAVVAERAANPAAAETPTDMPAERADLDREIEELRRKLASMTSVNLEALAEAEELATRLATLEAQLADVAGAKESIEQLITRIDDESRRLLGDTIETVRGHFRELFERLFGGGQADIVLEPGVDLLETAVEIVARPPGKEPRSISLLSGGEKTMTCVALLLAIFRSRPSPFCVLDEVDAALDEANVDRYVAVLRDFLSATQFIVVTHSKKTMAAATTLYGVTMEESGVSKRVSVRFESTAVAARPAARAA